MKGKRHLLALFIVMMTLVVYQDASAQFEPRGRSEPDAITVEAMADGPEQSAAEIFAAVSPAIASISTPVAGGSGVLIEHNYLLTNAHVVWPYRQVRVVFPDGSEYKEVPVYGWDLMADLALLGPIETSIEPLPLVDGSDIAIGRNVYLIGYPLEVEEFPQPSITSGILSRMRKWDTLDLSLLQADATITGGQSGGVMVTYQGDVVGISTFYWGDFAIATSVADALPRLQAILDRDYSETLGTRRIYLNAGGTSLEDELYDDWDELTYVLNLSAGDKVDLFVDGIGLPYFSVVDEYGTPVVDSHAKGETAEVATFTAQASIPYYVQVYQYSTNRNTFELASSHPLSPVVDVDDGDELRRGQVVTGSLDTPADYDTFYVYMHANELVEILVDSLGLDTSLLLQFLSSTREEYVSATYGAGGVFGHNSKIVYRAPTSGVQRITVSNAGETVSLGGYFLSIKSAPSSAMPSVVEWARDLADTPSGLMAKYESEDYGFELLYPPDWSFPEAEDCLPETAILCVDGPQAWLTVVEEDLVYSTTEAETLEQYVDLLLKTYEFETPGFELISREPVETLQGSAAERFEFTSDVNETTSIGFVFMDEENRVVFDATYVTATDQYDWLEPVVTDSFNSFRAWAGRDRQTDPIHFLDEGLRYLSEGNHFAALTALNKAIKLDPNEARYSLERARVHYAFDDLKALRIDLTQATTLDAENPRVYFDAADLLYRSYQYDDAHEAVSTAIQLDPIDPTFYTLRAKTAALQGDSQNALADLSMAKALSEDNLAVDAVETRGFVHILTENYDAAKADFDGLFFLDWRSPHILLGRGIAYAELGEETELADELLNEGIQLALDFGYVGDPQVEILYEMAQESLGRP